MMIDEIGKNAGLIWKILDKQNEIRQSELAKLSKLAKPDFLLALGWLARESKIALYETDKEPMVLLIY